MRVLAFVTIFFMLPGCYRGTRSLDEAEGKGDAAYVGMRLDFPDGDRAADTLVRMAGRGEPEATVVLENRLATLRAGPVRDHLDAAIRAAVTAGNPALGALAMAMAADGRVPYHQAGSRILSP